MKEFFKVVGALISFINNIAKASKRAKNEKEKQELLRAIRDGDINTINRILNQ